MERQDKPHVGVQLDPTYIILGEIQNVVAAMRLNSKWSSRSRSKGKETILLTNLTTLRKKIEGDTNVFPGMDIIEIFRPFLDIIRSEKTSGPITGVALSAVYKFLQYGFVTLDSNGVARAIEDIGAAVTNCRFEGTDPETDEVVLIKILKVLSKCIQVDAGAVMSDQLVYDMVQTCFKMSIQMHLSVLLRKSAEMSLMEILQYVFSMHGTTRKTDIEEYVAKRSPTPATPTPNASSTVAADTSTESSPMESEGETSFVPASPQSSRTEIQEQHAAPEPVTSPKSNRSSADLTTHKSMINPVGIQFDADTESEGEASAGPFKPFGLPVLVKLLRFLCSIVNPNYTNNTEPVRFLGLALINAVLEIRGSSLESSAKLMNIVKDDLCRYLLQSLHTDNVSILTMALRVSFNLFVSLRQKLKFQMELFFNFLFSLFDRSEEMSNLSDAASFEHQEVALETIVHLCEEPTFVVDMYINYDCDLNCGNMFEKLVEFLYKNSYPVTGAPHNIHLLALEGLIAILDSVNLRINNPPPTGNEQSLAADALKERKHIKTLVTTAAEHFNKKPQTALDFLQEKGLLPTPLDAKSVARFLRTTTQLSKTMIGEYLAGTKEFTAEVLKEYVLLFDYKNKRFVDVVREFLESFRISGESQVIVRILDVFTRDYFEREKGIFESLDGCYLVAMSIIMLNVDTYNQNVKAERRMSQEAFLKNLRGQNGGADFPKEWLLDIYHSIKESELRIPEEQPLNQEITQGAWRYFLNKFERVHQLTTADGGNALNKSYAGHYDALLFGIAWRQVTAAAKVVFAASADPDLVEHILRSFGVCADICAHFGMHHALDNVIVTLCELSSILASADTPTVTFEVRFSRDKKAQMAAKVLFEVASKHADHVREGWKNIVSCLVRLHRHDLLPTLFELEDIFKFKKAAAVENKPANNGSPLLGLMSSFWPFGGGSGASSAQNPEQTPSEQERQYKDKCRNAISEMPVSTLLNTAHYSMGSVDHLLKVLMSNSFSKKKAAKAGQSLSPKDEQTASIFCFDLITYVALQNAHRIKSLWPTISDHFDKTIKGLSPTIGPVLEKAIVSYIYIVARIVTTAPIANEMLSSLQILFQLPEEVAASFADKIRQSLLPESSFVLSAFMTTQATLALRNASSLEGAEVWATLLGLMRSTLNLPKFGRENFDALMYIVSPHHYGVRMAQSSPSKETMNMNLRVDFPKTFSFVTTENFAAVLETVSLFAKNANATVDIALESLELTQALFAVLPTFVHVVATHDTLADVRLDGQNEEILLNQYVVPLLQQFIERTRDKRLSVRHHAMTHLQKGLLAPEMQLLSSGSWRHIFDQLIFALLLEQLQPASPDTPRDVVEETRLRASSLLCKTFLHYMYKIDASSFSVLWIKVLSFVEMYMKADNSELLVRVVIYPYQVMADLSTSLAEAVTESLKNILLVMFASGLLVRPPASQSESVLNTADAETNPSVATWNVTWKTIDGFCPSLKNEFLLKVYPPTDVVQAAGQDTSDASAASDTVVASETV